jgi:hypothetical protein
MSQFCMFKHYLNILNLNTPCDLHFHRHMKFIYTLFFYKKLIYSHLIQINRFFKKLKFA